MWPGHIPKIVKDKILQALKSSSSWIAAGRVYGDHFVSAIKNGSMHILHKTKDNYISVFQPAKEVVSASCSCFVLRGLLYDKQTERS